MARTLLKDLTEMDGHDFWADDLPCSLLPWPRIAGYRQVTDAYLVTFAAKHGGRLATLDQALATVFPEALFIGASVHDQGGGPHERKFK